MSKLLFGGAVFVALAVSPAMAADAARPAPVYTKAPIASAYDWNGSYIGINGGGAWGTFDTRTSTVFSPIGYFATTSVPAIAGAGLLSFKPTSITGGGQIGHNVQTGIMVYGLEADINYLHLSGSAAGGATYPCCAPTAFTINASANTDWLITARARFGIAANNWLVYVTGGPAFTSVKGSFVFRDTFATAAESASISNSLNIGIAGGAGIEAGLMTGWTMKAEFLYVDFGSVTVHSSNLTAFAPPIVFPANTFTHSVNLKSTIARVGLNYRY
jgi:outer membrane immunogenic protein